MAFIQSNLLFTSHRPIDIQESSEKKLVYSCKCEYWCYVAEASHANKDYRECKIACLELPLLHMPAYPLDRKQH